MNFQVGQIVEHVTFPNFVGIVVKLEGEQVFRLGVLSQGTGQVFYDSPETWVHFNPADNSVVVQSMEADNAERLNDDVIDAEFREVRGIETRE